MSEEKNEEFVVEKELENEVGVTGSEEEAKVCPVCGFVDGSEVPTVSEEDLRAYFRAALGGKRFTKTYSFLNGELLITLQETTLAEGDKMIDLIRAEKDERDLLINAFRAKFAITCIRLEMGETTVIANSCEDISDFKKLVDFYNKAIASKGPLLDRLCDEALTKFNTLLEEVIRKAVTDSDF